MDEMVAFFMSQSRIVAVDMYEINAGFRAEGFSTKIFENVQIRHRANMFEGRAGFENLSVLNVTGNIQVTPWASQWMPSVLKQDMIQLCR
jgi:hypothetical protein